MAEKNINLRGSILGVRFDVTLSEAFADGISIDGVTSRGDGLDAWSDPVSVVIRVTDENITASGMLLGSEFTINGEKHGD